MRAKFWIPTIVLTLLLPLGAVVLPTAANAIPGVVTKTITVLDPDGAPYSGALVVVNFNSSSAGEGQSTLTPGSTTNAQGVATVSYPDDILRGELSVQPASGNTSLAVWTRGLENMFVTGPITVQLETSEFRFRVLKPNGTDAEIGVGVLSNERAFRPVRKGIFGIDIPSDFPTDSCQIQEMYYGSTLSSDANLFFEEYSAKASGTGSGRVLQFYAGRSCNTEIFPVNGVFELKLIQGNVSGILNKSNGQALDLTGAEGYSAQIFGIKDGIYPDYSMPGEWTTVQVDGSWFAKIDTSTAGKYQIKFESAGSYEKPSFFSDYFWIDGNGKFSLSSDLTLPTSSLAITKNIPVANVKLKVVSGETGNPIGAYIQISTFKSASPLRLFSGTISSFSAANLADGFYWIDVTEHPTVSTPTMNSSQYILKITNGVPTISEHERSRPTLSEGVWTLRGALPSNFDFRLVSPAGDPIQGSIGYQKIINGNYSGGGGRGTDSSGDGSVYLSDGTWKITANAAQESTLTFKRYTVMVQGGVVTVEGASKVDTRWLLTLPAPNISGFIQTSPGSNLVFADEKQGISLELQKFVTDHWEWREGGDWANTAAWGLNITEQGRYRITAVPYEFSGLAQSYSPDFWVDGSGKISLSEGSYTDTVTLNIVMKAPNLLLRVINPIDQSLLPGGWVTIEKELPNGNREYFANANIYSSQPGLTGVYLSDIGQYILRVNPPQGSNSIVGLSSKDYQVSVTADSVTVTSDGVDVAKVDERFVLSPAIANITARIVYPGDGGPFANFNGRWLNANVQKWNTNGNYWEWGNNWAQIDQNGYISLSVLALGKYRIRLEPQGDSSVTTTYSEEFTITPENILNFRKDFGNIALQAPAIKVSVKASNSQPLNNIGIEIRKNGQQIDWANTGNNGVAAVSLPSAGSYEFIVTPNSDVAATASRKSYAVTAVSENGVITATATVTSGVSVSNGVTTLELAAPTISGTVKHPLTAATIANSQVYAVEAVTNREMWEYSANSNQNGQWSMSLPKGSYKVMARAPWGSAEFGNSIYSDIVVVDETGTATSLLPEAASNFTLTLQVPTWSGTVKSPDGTRVVPNARVCLRLNISYWNCTNATTQGAWALSAPDGYNSNFIESFSDAYLEAADDFTQEFTMFRAQSPTAVAAILGNGGPDKEIRLTSPNTKITVTAGGNPAAGIWVSAERDGEGWLGGAKTDANGIASLSIADTSTALRIRADINGYQLYSANYSTTQKNFSPSQILGMTSNGIFATSIPLDTPNFRVIVREPGAGGVAGPIIAGAWVDMFNESEGEWKGGSSTNSDGQVAFKVSIPSGCPDIVYSLNVSPAWNSNSIYTRQSYKLLVNCNGAMTLSNKTDLITITPQSIAGQNVYSVTLGVPTITGIIVDPSNLPVANSWILPVNTDTYEWMGQIGSNSRQDGTFGISAPAGNYRLEANIPWGASDLAKPATCNVTVFGGAVTSTAGGCIQPDKSIKLALRAPNVTMTLKSGGVAVPYANVSLAAGSWYVNAQTNNLGKVSFFVDAAEIRSLNNTSSQTPLRIWVDPPYGASTMARWECNAGDLLKPICKDLVPIPATGDYPDKFLGDVTGVEPNTKIRVGDDNGIKVIGAWINLFIINPTAGNYGKRWLAAGGSDKDGFVALNIDTSTVTTDERYVIEVYAPWNKRSSLSTKEHTNAGDGYTWNEINTQTFNLAAPNLKITVQAPSGSDRSKWGWIGVQEIDINNNLSWVSGNGLDDFGATSLYLGPNKRFKILANPGPGRPGVQTECNVETDASGIVATIDNECLTGTQDGENLSLRLNGGNVVGRVLRDSDSTTAVSGAIVFAVADGEDESAAVISCTSDDGYFGLVLDSSKTWAIKIFPVKKDGEVELSSKLISGINPPASGTDPLPVIYLEDK